LRTLRKAAKLAAILHQAMPIRFPDNRLSRAMPMSHAKLYRCFFARSLLLPVPALAQTACTTQAVNVRADPDRAFPLVA
jgi:hypothetical protein